MRLINKLLLGLGIICSRFRSPVGIKRPFCDIGGGGETRKERVDSVRVGGHVLELSNKEVTHTPKHSHKGLVI